MVPTPLPVVAEDFGPQFLDVDRKGNVYLLRSETLEVFRLEPNGKLVLAAQLKQATGPGTSGVVRQAVLGSGPDEWFLLRGQSVWRADTQRAQALPPVGWVADSLSRQGGGEVIAGVLPFGTGRTVKARTLKEGLAAPLLFAFSGSEWSRLVEEGKILSLEETLAQKLRIHQERMLALAPSSGRKLWAADRYRYRIRQFSPAGRVLWSLTGSLEIREQEDPEGKAPQAVLGAAGDLGKGTGTQAVANLAIQAILGLTEGVDGKLYLVSHMDGPALDRFDPVSGELVRVPLELPYLGYLTLAATIDGLYLATFTGAGGRFFVPQARLDGADWRPVQGVEIGG